MTVDCSFNNSEGLALVEVTSLARSIRNLAGKQHFPCTGSLRRPTSNLSKKALNFLPLLTVLVHLIRYTYLFKLGYCGNKI